MFNITNIEPWVIVPVVILAMFMYVYTFVQVRERYRKKYALRQCSNAMVKGETVGPFPENMYYFVVDTEGKIKEHSLYNNVVGLNLEKNLYMGPVYKKIMSKGELGGGGYTYFKWQDDGGRLNTHLAYSKKQSDGNMLCVCSRDKGV